MPAHAIDYTGMKFGMLTALEDVGTRHQKRLWRCRCDCGAETTITSARLGLTLSCGCIQRAQIGVLNSLRRRKPTSQSTEYKSWASMIQRCLNPTAPNYHLYGGRGIEICEEWQGKDGFAAFARDMGKRPLGTSLDRFPDKDGNYQPDNCRWADATQQSNNRRDTPEYAASRKATLDAGRKRMWEDPEIRARLVEDRRHRGRRMTKQPKGP